MMDVSEKNFEATIEAALLAGGPDAGTGVSGAIGETQTPFGIPSHGYHKRKPEDYDRLSA